MSDFLAEMGVRSRARADAALSLRELRARAADQRPPALALSALGFDLIAEVKRVAPSAGRLDAGAGDRAAAAAARACAYGASGAAAVSVLTEPSAFDGDLADLAAAAAACPVPVMRKDFLVDVAQVWEAAAAGAGGVLLIAKLLPGGALSRLVDAAAEAGLFALVEAFDDDDLDRAAGVADRGRVLVGVNTRDLRTLAVDPGRLARLAPRFSTGALAAVPGVAESGLVTAEDARTARRLGYRLALVGSALMRAPDPGGLVAAMIAAGRGA